MCRFSVGELVLVSQGARRIPAIISKVYPEKLKTCYLVYHVDTPIEVPNVPLRIREIEPIDDPVIADLIMANHRVMSDFCIVWEHIKQ